MSRPFRTEKHIINASHLREYPRGMTNAFDNIPRLKLSVNQYIPSSIGNNGPQPGDITIVFGHANAFHKELYEPYFEDILRYAQESGVRVRAIWSIDAAHQGASGILNENVIGDDPCWNDYARDILHMVNHFRDHMSPPIIGAGHSFGGHAMARVALMHPALFTGLVLLEPVIEDAEVFRDTVGVIGVEPAKSSAYRVDTWSSYAEAEKYFRSRPFYQAWDPRVLDIHLKHGLRKLPTPTYPNKQGVALATPKIQEVGTFLRMAVADPASDVRNTFRKEPGDTFRQLHKLAPPVLYILGADSPFSSPEFDKRKMAATREAELVLVQRAGHLLPQQRPTECAAITVPFLSKIVEQWKKSAEEDKMTPRPRHLSRKALETLAKI